MGFSDGWKRVLDTVLEFEDSTITRRVWFRGHSHAEYYLIPGLFRLDLGPKLFPYLAHEVAAYSLFVDMGKVHHDHIGWDALFLMQHYGVRTRLLDWSQSFATALFFACQDWMDGTCACVWMLDPAGLNSLSLGYINAVNPMVLGNYDNVPSDPLMFKENSAAVFPTITNSRLLAQQGMFTIQGNSLQPLDQQFDGALLSEGTLKQIVLTPDLKEDALRYLKHTGVNHYSLFPDLDGLAKYVNTYNDRETTRLLSRDIDGDGGKTVQIFPNSSL